MYTQKSYWGVSYRIYDRCLAMGLKKIHALEFEKTVSSWIQHSGPEWAVRRLKDLKLDLIREKAGLSLLCWVRKNRRGDWYGVLGALQRMARKDKAGFSLAVNCLMAASALKPPEPTEKHVATMRKNLSAEPVALNFELRTSLRVPDLAERPSEYSSGSVCSEIVPLCFQEGCSSKMSPLPRKEWVKVVPEPTREGQPKFRRIHSTPKNSNYLKELTIFDDTNFWTYYLYFREFYEPIFSGLVGDLCCFGSRKPLHCGDIIGLNKDGSWKIRWIASPFRSHQWALKPFSERLFKLLADNCPWDYTFRQEKAIPKLQSALKSGHVCHSVDLYSATDFFPLELQLSVLKQLNPTPLWNKAVELFEAQCRGTWSLRSTSELLRWKKGQPMGMQSSFPAFALTHGLFLNQLAGGRDVFAILGDDVVIWDDAVYQSYMEQLKLWQVPVSGNKCLSSSRICEFAGAIITEDSVFRCFKWRDTDDENFLQQMIQFGKRFRKILTWRARRVYDLVSALQPPIGCNHAVSDMAYSVFLTDKLLSEKETQGSRYLDLFEWLTKHSRLMQRYSLRRIRAMQATFDEKVNDAIKKLPFLRGYPLQGLRAPLGASLEANRCEPDTPHLDGVVEKPSQLQILEQLLRNGLKRHRRTARPKSTASDWQEYFAFYGWQIFYDP
jgi:hypothetical protein